MPDPVVDEVASDFNELVDKKDPDENPAPEPVAEVAAEAPPEKVEETPAEPAPEAKPKKETPEWSKAVTRTQQRVASLESKLDKLLALNGIEPEAAPAAQEKAAADLPSETQMEIAQLRQKVEFTEIRQKFPGSDPDVLWKKAWDHAFETLDVEEDADVSTLPKGTVEALTKVANKQFQAQVAKLKAAPKPATPAPTPHSPQRRLPPKTASGAGAPRTPASQVPVPSTPISERDEMLRDCRELVGGDD